MRPLWQMNPEGPYAHEPMTWEGGACSVAIEGDLKGATVFVYVRANSDRDWMKWQDFDRVGIFDAALAGGVQVRADVVGEPAEGSVVSLGRAD